jgi:transcriptional regulator with XRE-family HTH domain
MATTPQTRKTNADGERLSRVAFAIERAVNGTSLTQREIAKAVGFKNENMIAMIKLGKAKLPLDRVPAMAKVLGIDPANLFRMALEQFYTDEQVRSILEIVDLGLPRKERAVIEYIREASGGRDIELTDNLKQAIDQSFA